MSRKQQQRDEVKKEKEIEEQDEKKKIDSDMLKRGESSDTATPDQICRSETLIHA